MVKIRRNGNKNLEKVKREPVSQYTVSKKDTVHSRAAEQFIRR